MSTRAECLNEHWFLSVADAQEQLDGWREDYNRERPHGSLENMTPDEFAKQALGTVGIDAILGPDDRELPIIVGDRAYAHGVAVRAPGSIEFAVPQGVSRLTARAGISVFKQPTASVVMRISQGDTELFATGTMTQSASPADIDISVTPGEPIRVEAISTGDAAGAVAVLADPVLLPKTANPPPSFSRAVTEDEVAVQQMRLEAADFSFELPDSEDGYVIYEGHPMDAIDPTLPPLGTLNPQSVQLWASPGEYEAAQFIIATNKDMGAVEVSVTDIKADVATIPSSAAEIYLIRRGLHRDLYPHPPEARHFETTSRFLFPNREFWLEAGMLKEVPVLVHVPSGAVPTLVLLRSSGWSAAMADASLFYQRRRNVRRRSVSLLVCPPEVSCPL